jgi:hypothetical protein
MRWSFNARAGKRICLAQLVDLGYGEDGAHSKMFEMTRRDCSSRPDLIAR